MTQGRKNLYLVLLASVLFGGLVIAQQSADVGQPKAPRAGTTDAEQTPTTDTADEADQDTESPIAATQEESASIGDSRQGTNTDEGEAENEQRASTEGLISNATMEIFVPSEEISEDRSVSYPNDI